MTRTLVLDLDGTLVDSVPDLTAALNRLMATRDLPGFPEPEVMRMVGDGAGVLLQRAFAARGRSPDATALADFLADYGANAAVHTRAFPDVPETLQRLTDLGWRLAVCTNKPEAPARTLLGALGLARFFAAIGGGDSFPVRKPDPAHLLATLTAAGGTPAQAVMAGDHHNDVLAAKGLGMPAIFAAWGYGSAEVGQTANAVAARFSELPEIAARLLDQKK
ncbi:Phosphoglycolate phosphatase [Rhodovastum atsumiense]|uniref:Phosphoglycolate phosphatase n=1 Tax=Rhodovastum atsumiense TaxID=504468 RepID=A0A5M6IPG5_9PROT|nr:HAD-IA family hydrolase [Rhodovastum atsumiense]KAA5609789.1 HAD-IA family hydrolase [Rhodovastum atsumiense]CAH2599428.1 Phosphoglycolate phosphatase [Rhodovastum atsumiense]